MNNEQELLRGLDKERAILIQLTTEKIPVIIKDYKDFVVFSHRSRSCFQ